MELIGLIVIVIWLISRSSGVSPKESSSSKGGLNSIEKYKTFESFRKK